MKEWFETEEESMRTQRTQQELIDEMKEVDKKIIQIFFNVEDE